MTKDAQAAWRCRYRLVTGCNASHSTAPGRSHHEKTVHADVLTLLLDCPECGESSATETGRGQHISSVHGLAAASDRRQELDAQQVKEILSRRNGAAANGTPAVPMSFAPVPRVAPDATVPAAPSLNGQPVTLPPSLPAAADLAAASDILAALIAEVGALRAENAELRAESARFAEIRVLLAAQE